ncbi:MAG: lamin tail domain-containing protein, partial [Polyangiales bacterium]
MKISFHSFSALSLFALAVGCGQQAPAPDHTGTTSQPLSTGIVISAVYGAGGATAAAPKYKSDYVELFNRGATAVSLSGMSLQYATTQKSTTPTLDLSNGAWNVSILPAVSIAPGQYFLIEVFTPTGTPAGADLPTPDFDGTGGVAGADA